MSSSKWWTPHFKTKKLLEQKIRSIAAAAPIGAHLGDIDTQFMLWVFSHHDEFEEKCGVGFKDFLVGRDQHGNRYFLIERSDGSKIDISWTHALTPNSSKRKWFIAALRQEVSEQIIDFRKSSGRTCGICGGQISGISHVDHVKPFRGLVSDFFGNDVHETIDMGEYSLLADRVLAQKWRDYHHANATLQITHKNCNLKKG
jgi:hypothetical protein